MSACATTEVEIRERSDAGHYQNHVRSDLVRNQLKDSFQSIRRIQSTVMYQTYQFDIDDTPLRSDLEGVNFENVALEIKSDNHSTAGTAIVLSAASNGRVAFITAAHTVTFADTIWHYTTGYREGIDNHVEAVSVRENLNQFVFTDDGIELIELVLADERRDLAIMRSKSPVRRASGLDPISIPVGDISQLDWSDMIYAVGYPRGVQMISQGTLNLTQHPVRTLIIDISLNRGFSGGAVYAVRSDGSGLEWVGIITSTLGERESYLAPEAIYGRDYPEDFEYSGNMYVKNTTRIFYGMTNAVDVGLVRNLILENWNELRDSGIRIPIF